MWKVSRLDSTSVPVEWAIRTVAAKRQRTVFMWLPRLCPSVARRINSETAAVGGICFLVPGSGVSYLTLSY